MKPGHWNLTLKDLVTEFVSTPQSILLTYISIMLIVLILELFHITYDQVRCKIKNKVDR